MKTTLQSDRLYALRRKPQQGFCVRDAAGDELICGSGAKELPVFPHKMIFAEKKELRQLIQRELFGIMRKQIFTYLDQLSVCSACLGGAPLALWKAGNAQVGQ